MGTVRAISLWQPWATLVAVGAKTVETRPRRTSITGPIVIHAAGKASRELRELCRRSPFREVLAAAGFESFDALPLGALVGRARLKYATQIPADLDNPGVEGEAFTCCKCGHIREAHAGRDHSGVCRVPVRWQPPGTPERERVVTNTFDGHTACCACPGYRRRVDERERAFGDYRPGRWAWVLADARPLPEPVPYCGRQGWFFVDESLLAGGAYGHV